MATGGIDMNHAMIYSRNVDEALKFYRDLLGLEVLEEVRTPHGAVYARLKAGSGATIALHALERGAELHTGGVRLYFEVRNLEAYCKRLEKKGAKFSSQPAIKPWGWKHAYLDDPDGHEVSIYWAGAKRFKKSPPQIYGADGKAGK
jgi:catechol 2,3-dioxygenase-like lactoylglutathione lyase family enzyme